MTDTDSDSIGLWHGRLSIGIAPDKDTFSAIVKAGFTHLGCCLTEREIAASLPHSVRQAGLHWTWLPFTPESLSESSDTHYLRQYLSSLRKMLQQQRQVYLFCDEDKIRCVLLVYALCLNAGMSASAAYSAVWQLAGQHAHRVSRAQLRAVAQMDYYG